MRIVIGIILLLIMVLCFASAIAYTIKEIKGSGDNE
jgi:hypothetical protein